MKDFENLNMLKSTTKAKHTNVNVSARKWPKKFLYNLKRMKLCKEFSLF